MIRLHVCIFGLTNHRQSVKPRHDVTHVMAVLRRIQGKLCDKSLLETDCFEKMINEWRVRHMFYWNLGADSLYRHAEIIISVLCV